MAISTDIPTKEPASITAGNTVKWTRDLSASYPADTWTLTYYLINQSKKYTINAVADGQVHSVTIPSATSKDYVAGTYKLIGRVTDGSETYEPEDLQTTVEVKPDLAAASVYDIRTHNKKVLDALEARLEGRALNGDQVNLTIGGVSIQLLTPEQLRQWADEYRYRYEAEVGQKTGRIHTQFTEYPV